MKFGIIGFGRFGKLWANALLAFGEVLVYDKYLTTHEENSRFKMATLAEVCQAEVIFLIVPISDFARTCEHIKPLLNPQSLVIDCCSVKEYPIKMMQQVFTESQALIGTHPLFGPDSVKKTGGLTGHKIVLCPVTASKQQEKWLENILQQMGLQILISTAQQHDLDMANSQGLVHFIGRGLEALDLQPQAISTPDFQALLNINQMVVNDSWQLFLDMHRYNAYTKMVRKKLLRQLTQLDHAIEQAKI